MLKEFFKEAVQSFSETVDEFEDGYATLRKGLAQLITTSNQGRFRNTADVLNFLLSEVPNHRCEFQEMKAGDGFDVILSWLKKHKKGDRYYMVKAEFKDGATAIGVFFADESTVFVAPTDSKICFKCTNLPQDLADMFDGKNIFVQQFN